MWALPGGRLPRIVISVGLGVVTVAALSVAAFAETSSAHGRHAAAAAKHHRQRVSHFNVAATHSPKILRQLAGHAGNPKNGVTENEPGSALADAAQGVDVAGYQHPDGASINWRKV